MFLLRLAGGVAGERGSFALVPWRPKEGAVNSLTRPSGFLWTYFLGELFSSTRALHLIFNNPFCSLLFQVYSWGTRGSGDQVRGLGLGLRSVWLFAVEQPAPPLRRQSIVWTGAWGSTVIVGDFVMHSNVAVDPLACCALAAFCSSGHGLEAYSVFSNGNDNI